MLCQDPEFSEQTHLCSSFIHLLFLLSTSFLFFFFQDTLNNNSLGKKYSWQEKVSGSSSPLKTGELPHIMFMSHVLV